MTSIQAAVTTDKQTYQAAETIATDDNGTVINDTTKVTVLTTEVTNVNDAAGSFAFLAAVVGEAAAFAAAPAAALLAIPGANSAAATVVADLQIIAGTLGLVSASLVAASLKKQADLNDAVAALTTDAGTLAQDQANAAGAYAQLQADMDTETALAAAYDVMNQAYTSSEQAYTSDQTTSAQVQAQGDNCAGTRHRGRRLCCPATTDQLDRVREHHGPQPADRFGYDGGRRHQSDGPAGTAIDNSGR